MSKRELASIYTMNDFRSCSKWVLPVRTLPPVWSWMPHSPKHRADLIARVECELKNKKLTENEWYQLYDMRDALTSEPILYKRKMLGFMSWLPQKYWPSSWL